LILWAFNPFKYSEHFQLYYARLNCGVYWKSHSGLAPWKWSHNWPEKWPAASI